MSDLIKRSDAIKIMACEMYAEAQSQGYEVDSIEDFMPEAKTWMNDAPSADRPQGWIPCSERLPREEEQDDELGVLVTLGNGYSGIQYDWYHGDHWYDWDGYVLAWMPLPKPWKGADDD